MFEEIATQVSIALRAEKIISFFSNQGIINNENKFISKLFSNDVKKNIFKLE
ncbi:MAG: hypothetical protein ICW73_01455 [Buchnera aphidicola (Pentalonia nigronervosa)]|jgi:amino-acid N-acetyltransferase|uniref:Uncharacterized protein n=1 Tax=Buchnera aphidicola (Pentalonia nigronervosa) TaxID=1309793 RepID=A0A7H1AYU2_9GAMM|nr:MAG: hypothetical protein ICW73_01455 [Buchnera aphidicola (Pentalonia nigronervosa)]